MADTDNDDQPGTPPFGAGTPVNNNDHEMAEDTQLVLASKELPDRIFILPSGQKPIFPGMLFPMLVGEGSTAELLKAVAREVPDHTIGFVLAKEAEGGGVPADVRKRLHKIGTVARILKLQEAEDGTMQALFQGEKRFEILKVAEKNDHIIAQVMYLEDVRSTGDDVKALGLAIINTMRDLIKSNPIFSEEIKMFLSRTDWGDAGRLADFAVTMTSSTKADLQSVLECLDVKERLEKALFLLRQELDINLLKEKITHQIEEKITQQQREFFLREQLKAIKQELGLEKDDKDEEEEKFRQRIKGLVLPEEARTRIEEELDKLRLLSQHSSEYGVSRTYLEWLTTLPWGWFTEDHLDVAAARTVLDRDHYGLEDVKARILEFIGVAKLKGKVEGSILCLIGPPGVGKTSLGRAIAEALGRKFYRFSLGGMRDEAEIKGHRRTYIGALPGKVLQAMKTVGSSNPVIMLDEIDKVGSSFHGDPASALLEVLDPEQNASFRDHYLDVPFDLSKVLFIATANVPDTIPGPLLDRMEVIHLSGYILDEKLHIATRHLVPKLLEKNGLLPEHAIFTDAAMRLLINSYAREAGVRALEKAVGGCFRKIAAGRAEEKITTPVRLTPAKVQELLGKPRFLDDPLMRRGKVGVIMGLAWTPMGGTTLYVEALAVPGDKGIKLTGQLGEVMTESSHIALSIVSARAVHFGVDKDFFQNKVIHIHVPAGATPKDGPSAGVTMASALLSLALRRRVPAHLAMTGELTLTGRVLPVGGIKEKVIAAQRSHVLHIILPKGNEKDFLEIPERVRHGITPHYVEDYQEVFDLALGGGLAGHKEDLTTKYQARALPAPQANVE